MKWLWKRLPITLSLLTGLTLGGVIAFGYGVRAGIALHAVYPCETCRSHALQPATDEIVVQIGPEVEQWLSRGGPLSTSEISAGVPLIPLEIRVTDDGILLSTPVQRWDGPPSFDRRNAQPEESFAGRLQDTI